MRCCAFLGARTLTQPAARGQGCRQSAALCSGRCSAQGRAPVQRQLATGPVPQALRPWVPGRRPEQPGHCPGVPPGQRQQPEPAGWARQWGPHRLAGDPAAPQVPLAGCCVCEAASSAIAGPWMTANASGWPQRVHAPDAADSRSHAPLALRSCALPASGRAADRLPGRRHSPAPARVPVPCVSWSARRPLLWTARPAPAARPLYGDPLERSMPGRTRRVKPSPPDSVP